MEKRACLRFRSEWRQDRDRCKERFWPESPAPDRTCRLLGRRRGEPQPFGVVRERCVVVGDLPADHHDVDGADGADGVDVVDVLADPEQPGKDVPEFTRMTVPR